MALIIVTGGTTGAADGTAISQGGAGTNPLVFAALNTPIDAHIRCDSLYYTTDQTVTLPAGVEISFNGGSTWYGSGTNPNATATGAGLSGTDVEDVNYPVKLRQVSTAASTVGSMSTDGSYVAITALATLSGLTATRSAAGATVDLAWTAVANRTYYKIERATAADFSTGLTTLSSTATATTYADTGRTAGTNYFYRVTPLGTGRYSDGLPAAIGSYPSGLTHINLAATSQPVSCCVGPRDANGYRNVWGVSLTTNKVWRVNPDLTVSEFTATGAATGLVDICVGPDGASLWFTTSGKIIKVSGDLVGTPTQTAYTVTAAYGICAGPDGNLWMTDYATGIHKVNPATGTVTNSYTVTGGGSVRFITTDGTDLFASDRTRGTTGAIVRCTTAGSITSTVCPDTGADPMMLTWDGSNLYMAAQGVGKLYKVTNGGTQTFTGYTVNASAQPTGVTVGRNGLIYTSGYNASYANVYSMPAGGGSFTNCGALTAAGNFGIVGHPSDSVFVCEYGSAKVARYAP